MLTLDQVVDLHTVKKEDLTFSAPFTLKATRNDCKKPMTVGIETGL